MPSISSEMRALYDAHFDLVWRYMAQRSVRQAEIDDLVHKVFRVVREHPSRYQMRDKPGVLVCMVARQVLREHQSEHGSESRDDADALTEVFERDAVSELVLGGLESMTDIEREAYLLCDGEGMSMEDVALAIGVPELAVQRKRARASRQMNEFVAKMRSSGIWRSPQHASEGDLLHSLRAACTPSDRDRDRVFAAMIAYSLTTRATGRAREPAATTAAASHTPAPRASTPPRRPANAPEGMPRPLAISWPPHPVNTRSLRVWSAVALAIALVAIGMGRYFSGATHAAEQPRALHVAKETPPRTGASAAEPKRSETRPIAAPPVAAATVTPVQPAKQPPAVEARASARAESAQAPTTDGKAVHATEAKLLFAAEHAYLTGNASLALSMLIKHRRSYPSTAYTIERKVLLGQVLCTKGRYREAQRQALELEAMDANPAALAAVYRVCSGNGGH